MNRKTIWATLLLTSFAFALAHVARPALVTPGIGDRHDADAKVAIRGLMETYIQSIDAADTKLGAEVWSTTPDVSFINPLGTEHGWGEISTVVYTKLMGDTFSQRTLKPVGDPEIQIYNDAAVVTFDWDFVATFRADGKPAHTSGRETQVYAKLPEKGWRLVHVHYSGPPATTLG